MESRYLHEIMNNRFHVLDEARQIRVNDRMHITFSIGVGDGGSTLAESEKFARQSLDMARGTGRRSGGSENGKRVLLFRRCLQGHREEVQNQDSLHCPCHAGTDRKFRSGVPYGTPLRAIWIP